MCWFADRLLRLGAEKWWDCLGGRVKLRRWLMDWEDCILGARLGLERAEGRGETTVDIGLAGPGSSRRLPRVPMTQFGSQ
jgi:hypothetical protein